MAIPEPSSALGLWPKVKAVSGWPQTQEESMFALADGWTLAGEHFQQPAGFSTAPGNAAWTDQAGSQFSAATVRTVDRAIASSADISLLAQAAKGFGNEVMNLKNGLNDLINANLDGYAAIQGLPAGVRALFEPVFVAQVASYALGLVTTATASASALGAVPVSTGGGANSATAAAQVTTDPLAGIPPAPPPGASPAEVAAYWNSIPTELRALVAQQRPEQIGNLDGIPAEFRDLANRALLGRQRLALEAERRAVEAELLPPNSPGGQAMNPDIKRRLGKIDDKILGLDTLTARLNSTNPATRNADGFFLLGLDPAGDGRFIVARGNPDTAANVATFVPGSLTGLKSAGTLLDQGDALHRAAIRSGSPSTSVITWLDYDSPDSIPAAAFLGQAEEAAPRLDAFQEGLRVTHAGPPSHNSVVGHSYGSTVTGLAASQGRTMPVDEIIAAGSPTLAVPRAADLSVGARHVWVFEAPKDPIGDNIVFNDPGHVVDPSDDEFGARVYSTEPGPPVSSLETGYTVDAHESYFREVPGNAGLDRMGDIIAGHEPAPR